MHKAVLWIQGVLIPAIGPPGLFLVAVLDSSYLSIPEVNDLLVVTSATAFPSRAWLYILMATLGSVAGAMTVDPARFAAVGLEINANHVRPAGHGFVVATARPEAMGRTTQVWSIRIEDEDGKLVCISRFTLAVIPRDRGAPSA